MLNTPRESKCLVGQDQSLAGRLLPLHPLGLSQRRPAAILFLVRFERRHHQDIQPAAFRTTDHGKVLKDIHLAQCEGGRVCPQTGSEPDLRCELSVGLSGGRLRLFRCRRPNGDIAEHEMMGKPAGGASQDELIACGHPSDRYAQRMHRPTLLEESPAVKDLSHRVQCLPIQEREHEHHTY
jgi:hypothetical protein